MMKVRSIIPSVKYRRPNLLDGLFTSGLCPGPLPEVVKRQIELNNSMQAEALALYRIEQKHPKKLVHDPPSPEE